ncbi:hypothetical protein PLICRDRAFT_103857 [Plicaturopsis crispa FD-325 SS-3]|nr:hypothetical protein PLICRDRAFT_103857 [Plicaturopsis crispa FD-325 SS-3]
MPTPSRHTSVWGSSEILSGIRKFEHGYEEFDPRNASQAHLAFAEGDMPANKFSRFYNYLLNVSIVTRWILFIVPVLAIVWIPGILGLTRFPKANVWGVKLLFWSIWLSIVWVGWWTALALARILPRIARVTIGLIAVGARRYIDWLDVLHRYVALFAWTITIWITWNPLIDRTQDAADGSPSDSIINDAGKLLEAFALCSGVLLFEKFSIQWIAGKFHERSYAERIADLKFGVRTLVTLYRHSSDIPGRSDTLRAHTRNDSKSFFKKALKGVKVAATTTTTAFGNVASEIAGSSVLQPNSPQSMVKTALESANKSRLLARRLFYSFVQPGADVILVSDIARFFPDRDAADAAFALFDKDSNGDASRDEVEMACMEFHREQLSIEHSMQDLDSAVGRLDNILMSLYFVVAILIIAVALEAQLLTLVTGAGTLILGLSWLIGNSLQEVLTSIIFLFIKHPFDVGDRVNLGKSSYTVKEIRLLSTIFLDGNGTLVQAPNTVLNEKMSEPFTFDVAYDTTFEQLEALRERMLVFLTAERRDYLPTFDVTVIDFPEQEKMTLKADIKHKSNFQIGAIKAKRRNKWICALKIALAECHIFGPKGDPDKTPDPKRYTLVPWDQVEAKAQKAMLEKVDVEPKMPAGGFQLMDTKKAMNDAEDVFGESNEVRFSVYRSHVLLVLTVSQLNMPIPSRAPTPGPSPQPQRVRQRPTASTVPTLPYGQGPETIELAPRSGRH